MTTKEQERKALEQIKKIIAGLGEGSYIATAMDGMIEDAEENIENDWAMSWKDRAESATERFETAEVELVKVSKDKALLQSEVNSITEAYETKAKVADEWKQAYNRVQNEANEQAIRIEELELENIKLKAKLYDMMVK